MAGGPVPLCGRSVRHGTTRSDRAVSNIHLAYAVLVVPLDALCFYVDRTGDIAAQKVSTLVFGLALLGLRGLVIISSAGAGWRWWGVTPGGATGTLKSTWWV